MTSSDVLADQRRQRASRRGLGVGMITATAAAYLLELDTTAHTGRVRRVLAAVAGGDV